MSLKRIGGPEPPTAKDGWIATRRGRHIPPAFTNKRKGHLLLGGLFIYRMQTRGKRTCGTRGKWGFQAACGKTANGSALAGEDFRRSHHYFCVAGIFLAS